MMKRLLLIALVALLVLGGVWWWPSSQSVDVTLTVAPDAPAGMQDITLVVGGDKTGWAQVQRGETVRARFQPTAQEVPELTLIYRLTPAAGSRASDEQHHWRGPAVSPGQGYDIRVLLDTQGRMVGAHCVKPCTLE